MTNEEALKAAQTRHEEALGQVQLIDKQLAELQQRRPMGIIELAKAEGAVSALEARVADDKEPSKAEKKSAK